MTDVFAGDVVWKDLLHQIKAGGNVPSYILDRLLGKYCASDIEAEIRIGSDALEEKAVQQLLPSRRFIRRKR